MTFAEMHVKESVRERKSKPVNHSDQKTPSVFTYGGQEGHSRAWALTKAESAEEERIRFQLATAKFGQRFVSECLRQFVMRAEYASMDYQCSTYSAVQ